VARVLIVGCGCRGRALAERLAAAGHAVRGTTRDRARAAPIEAAGAEAVVADPDRLGTLIRALAGVSVVCWLMGSAADAPQLHGHRLRTLVERLVDTPVRGLVYEGAGSAGEELLGHGADIVLAAAETWRIPVVVLDHDPVDVEAWLGAAGAAVEDLLAAGQPR
jgi:uncharacterized protein YbjT (DUF2867 family)